MTGRGNLSPASRGSRLVLAQMVEDGDGERLRQRRWRAVLEVRELREVNKQVKRRVQIRWGKLSPQMDLAASSMGMAICWCSRRCGHFPAWTRSRQPFSLRSLRPVTLANIPTLVRTVSVLHLEEGEPRCEPDIDHLVSLSLSLSLSLCLRPGLSFAVNF